jgi:hypothetical protein
MFENDKMLACIDINSQDKNNEKVKKSSTSNSISVKECKTKKLSGNKRKKQSTEKVGLSKFVTKVPKFNV